MPASYDDLCQRHESCVKNIQDSIYTLESFMGNNTAFTFNITISWKPGRVRRNQGRKSTRTPNKSIRGVSKSYKKREKEESHRRINR